MGPLDPQSIREKLRFLAVDKDGAYLFSSALRSRTVYVWQVGNPDHVVDWKVVEDTIGAPAFRANESFRLAPGQYLPHTKFELKGGYKPGSGYVGGPERLVVDSMNQNLFVVDEDGALYVYDFDDVLRCKPGAILEPYHIVSGIEGEMRDLKVSRPVTRGGSTGG
jgi:hypothetical protein